jgi:hypothetical protein
MNELPAEYMCIVYFRIFCVIFVYVRHHVRTEKDRVVEVLGDQQSQLTMCK